MGSSLHALLLLVLLAQSAGRLGSSFPQAGGANPTPPAPTVTTDAATSVGETTAVMNATVNPNGLSATGLFYIGIVSGDYLSTLPVTPQVLGSGTTPVTVSGVTFTGVCETTYYFQYQAFHEATGQIGYGAERTFTTTACSVPVPPAPTVTTTAATDISTATATLNGTGDPELSPTTCDFEYGLTTGYGTRTTPATDIGSGTSPVAISAPVTGLTCGATTYHFRASCTNAGGTVNGSDQSFATASCPPGGARTVLTHADLPLVGYFWLPFTIGTGGSQYAEGITIIDRSGTERLIAANHNSQIMEFSIPALVTSGTPNTATLIQNYGAPDPSLIINASGTPYTAKLYNLYYDNTTSYLYISFGLDYNAALATYDNAAVIQATINVGTGAMVGAGPWKISGSQAKAVQGGCFEIPAYWKSNVSNYDLACGVGGRFSNYGAGGGSYGPSAFAFDTPNPATSPNATLPATKLLHYPDTAAHYRFLRGSVTPALDKRYDAGPSPTLWTQDDILGMAWAWGTTKHGLVFNTHITAGVLGYAGSDTRHETGNHRIYIMDPDDLANVAAGSLQSYEPGYTSYWDATYKGVDYSVGAGVGPYQTNTVASLTLSGTTATVVTSAAHGLASGEGVVIKGATQAPYNIVAIATVVNTTTFTYPGVTAGTTSPATGTITAQEMQKGRAAPLSTARTGGMAFGPTTKYLYIAHPGTFGGSKREVVEVYGPVP